MVFMTPPDMLIWAVSLGSLVFLALPGALVAATGGASIANAVTRVPFWGVIALALTAGIARVFGTIV